MRKLGFVLAALVAGGVVRDAGATRHYISPTGNNSNAGTIGSPWKSLNRADDAPMSNDTLYCQGGVYADTLDSFSGSQSENLLITSYPDTVAVFQSHGKDFSDDASGRFRVFYDLQPCTTLRRIQILVDSTTVSGDVAIECGERVTLDSVTVVSKVNHGGGGAFQLENAVILNGPGCTVVRCDLRGAGSPDSASATGSVLLANADRQLIYNNRLSSGSMVVINVKASTGSIVRNNTITSAVGAGIYCGTRNLIEANTVTGAGKDSAVPAINFPGIVADGDSSIIRFNLIYSNTYAGARIVGLHNRFYNNDVWGNGLSGVSTKSSTSAGNKILNNVIAHNMTAVTPGGTTDGEIETGSGSDLIGKNNLFANNWVVVYTSAAWVANSIHAVYVDSLADDTSVSARQTARPSLFKSNANTRTAEIVTDASTYDFRPVSGSALLNAGRPVAYSSVYGNRLKSIEVDDAIGFWLGDAISVGTGSFTVLGVDVVRRTLSLSGDASWIRSEPVSHLFTGSAPEVGAYEYYVSSASIPIGRQRPEIVEP